MDAPFLDKMTSLCVPRKNSRVGVVLMLWGAVIGIFFFGMKREDMDSYSIAT